VSATYTNAPVPPLDPRVWRGVIRVGERNLGDPEDQLRCWAAYLDAGLTLDESSRAIHDYVHAWSLGNPQHPPDFDLVRGYFEGLGALEVVDYLGEVANAQQYISSNYKAVLQRTLETQRQSLLNRILRDSEAIAVHGRTEGIGKAKRVLRGVKDAVDFMCREVTALEVQEVRSSTVSLKAAKLRARERAARPRGRTGIATLDAALRGGLPGGKIMVVVAPAGHRKSSLGACLTASFAAQGWPVAYMGHDEGTDNASGRLDALEGEEEACVTMAESEAWLEDVAALVARRAEDMTRQATVARILRSPRSIGDEDNDVLIAQRAKEWGLVRTGVLVVDSVQSVPCRAAAGLPKFDAIEKKMEVMRAVAERHGVAVYATSESNRGFYSSKDEKQQSSGLSAGKGSSSIEYKADVLCSMRKGPDGVRLKVEKNRLGPDEPEIFLHFDGLAVTELGGPPAQDGDLDEKVVLDVIARNPTVSSCRLLFDACRIDGRLRNNTRIHEVVNSLILKGRIRGGNRKPFVVVATPTVEEMIS